MMRALLRRPDHEMLQPLAVHSGAVRIHPRASLKREKFMSKSQNPSARHHDGIRWLRHPGVLAAWCVVAAFGTYASMYGFRKPFTAAAYEGTPWGIP